MAVFPELALAVLLGRGILPTAGTGGAQAAREPATAEFAVRWGSSEGGFSSAREVLAFLGAPETKGEAYEVRYFDLAPPEGAPTDATTIVRRRSRVGGKTDIRLKYRMKAPLPGKWACPAGAPFVQSEEVDISFGGAGPPGRVYSYSCTLAATEPPAFLAAVPKRCASRMVRYAFQGFKIEEWTLPGGDVQLEVSQAGKNTRGELEDFERFVGRLRERGIRPTDRSKTELGSRCPGDGP